MYRQYIFQNDKHYYVKNIRQQLSYCGKLVDVSAWTFYCYC